MDAYGLPHTGYFIVRDEGQYWLITPGCESYPYVREYLFDLGKMFTEPFVSFHDTAAKGITVTRISYNNDRRLIHTTGFNQGDITESSIPRPFKLAYEFITKSASEGIDSSRPILLKNFDPYVLTTYQIG